MKFENVHVLLGAHELWARRTMCKSVFFLKGINCRRTFEAYSGLKSRGLGDSGNPAGREEIIEKL